MNKNTIKQEPKRREFFKTADTLPLELEEIRKQVEAMPIEEIQKKFPEELLRTIYRSFLELNEELHSKSYKRALKTAEYFLENFLKSPSFWKTLAYLKEEAYKTKQKDKPRKVKVKWDESGGDKKTKKQKT